MPTYLPYIGITGFTTQSEVMQILGQLESFGRLFNNLQLMMGVLVHDRTLQSGQASLTSQRFPAIETAKQVLQETAKFGFTLPLIHYNTHNPEQLGAELADLATTFGSLIDGVQLNACWPELAVVEVARCKWPRIVLQVGARAMSQCASDPDRIAHRIATYSNFITNVLLDPSGGEGRLADLGLLLPILRAIRDRCPDLGLGVAGGLCGETLVNNLRSAYVEFPNLSIDAEGRLRTQDDSALDIARCLDYVNQFFRLRSL